MSIEPGGKRRAWDMSDHLSLYVVDIKNKLAANGCTSYSMSAKHA